MSTLPQYILQDSEPLFPNILFNRPVTRQGAGTMLLIGGHVSQFSLPTAIHQLSQSAGLGRCMVVLPDQLAKLLAGAPGTFFVASNTSGSLAREALGRILELSEEADAVAIGASLSNNSDTAMLTERLLAELDRPIIVYEDALKAAAHNVQAITDNPNALVILTMSEAFKLCGALRIPIQIRPHAGLINKLEIIQDLKAASRCQYVVFGTEIIVAADTSMVVTPIDYRLASSPAIFYAVLGTFWIQNRTNRRAGLATAAYLIRAATRDGHNNPLPQTKELANSLDTILRQDDF